MSKLSTDAVLKLAKLAKLELSEEEIELFANDLGSIIGYFELLDNADISGLEATSQVTGLTNQFRADEVVEKQPATPEELLKLSPNSSAGYIKVKRMI